MDWKKQVAEFKSALHTAEPFIAVESIKVAFFGAVGDGKSVTGGICALGLTPEGTVTWIDGEGKRSGWAIDQVCTLAAKYYNRPKEDFLKRFKVIHIDPPYHPLRVLAAIEMAEEMASKCTILDILTQAWDADGGYLDMKNDEVMRMAGDDIKRQERSQAAAAAHIKPWTHQKLVNKVNSTTMNLVLLFQAKKKWDQEKKGVAEYTTPIQESGFTRTSLICGRVEAKEVNGEPQGGFCYFRSGISSGTKTTHPRILQTLPGEGQQFGFQHAEALLRLTLPGSNAEVAPKPTTTKKPVDPTNALKRQLWEITAKIHNSKKGDSEELKATAKKQLEQWLWDEGIMSDTETLESLTVQRLDQVVIQARTKAEEQGKYQHIDHIP